MAAYEVVWSQIDDNDILLGEFETKQDAETFAATLRPTEGFAGDEWHGVVVQPIRTIAPTRGSAKWRVTAELRSNAWHVSVYLIEPTGDEQWGSAQGETNTYRAELYALTRIAAITAVEQRYDVRFDVSSEDY